MTEFLLKLSKKQKLVILSSLLLIFLVIWVPSRFRSVSINYNGEIINLHTASLSLEGIINDAGIDLAEDDFVSAEGFDTYGFFGDYGQNTSFINIKSAINVFIDADGFKYHVTALTGDNVSNALDISGIKLRESDTVMPLSDSTISNGDNIKVTRVDYITTTEEEVIERGSIYRATSLFKSSKPSIISYGKNGTLLKTYQQKVVDGVTMEKELVSEDIIKRAVSDIYLLGDGSPCSPLDYGYEIVNGVPTTYKTVYTNQRATGYYAHPGAGTATGRLAQMGYVAVNPKIIPYGSKLWIVGTGDSSFVYGYALAADTGGAMLSGKNFVDLYYDTYYECVLNGVKRVDVYVLE